MLFRAGYDIVKTLETAVAIRQTCGNSSVVERYLAKVNVAGSSLVSRSNLREVRAVFSKIAAAEYGAIAKW